MQVAERQPEDASLDRSCRPAARGHFAASLPARCRGLPHTTSTRVLECHTQTRGRLAHQLQTRLYVTSTQAILLRARGMRKTHSHTHTYISIRSNPAMGAQTRTRKVTNQTSELSDKQQFTRAIHSNPAALRRPSGPRTRLRWRVPHGLYTAPVANQARHGGASGDVRHLCS